MTAHAELYPGSRTMLLARIKAPSSNRTVLLHRMTRTAPHGNQVVPGGLAMEGSAAIKRKPAISAVIAANTRSLARSSPITESLL